MVLPWGVVPSAVPPPPSPPNRPAAPPSPGPHAGAKKGGKKTRKYGESGLLFQVRWQRIVLDEGQVIKNPRTRVAQAAWALTATHRSATPPSRSIRSSTSCTHLSPVMHALLHGGVWVVFVRTCGIVGCPAAARSSTSPGLRRCALPGQPVRTARYILQRHSVPLQTRLQNLAGDGGAAVTWHRGVCTGAARSGCPTYRADCAAVAVGGSSAAPPSRIQ